MVARALTVAPDFLVLDEPVSNLDVSIQAQIVNLLLELRTRFELTYLFISHDLHLVAYVSDTIGVMFRGRMVERAPTASIMARPLHPYTQRLFSSVPDAVAEGAGGTDAVAEPVASAAEADPVPRRWRPRTRAGTAAQCPRETARCRAEEPGLRDAGGGHLVACWEAEFTES